MKKNTKHNQHQHASLSTCSMLVHQHEHARTRDFPSMGQANDNALLDIDVHSNAIFFICKSIHLNGEYLSISTLGNSGSPISTA